MESVLRTDRISHVTLDWCRERAAGMYAVIPYATAIGATEIPWALGQTLLFSCISYFMIHFNFTAGELIHLDHLIARLNFMCVAAPSRF